MRFHSLSALSAGALLLALLVSGCCTTVTVPSSAAADQAPTITIGALPIVPSGPGAAGEIDQQNVSSSTGPSATVRVTRGSSYQITGSAINLVGGVAKLTMTVSQGGAFIFHGDTTGSKNSSGATCTTLSLVNVTNSSGAPNQAMTVTMTDPVTVNATAVNFNGQSTSFSVVYVPTDLTVTMTASPSTIGYQQSASSSTLNWSAHFGVRPYTVTLNPQVVPDPVNTTSAVVSPSATTTYTLSVIDQVTPAGKSAGATVSVVPSPPAPKVHLTGTPNGAYAVLGVPQTISWVVDNCSTTIPCQIALVGIPTGYATVNVNLKNLPPISSFTMTPADTTDFTLTAISSSGPGHDTISMTIDPNSPGKQPTLMVFYFTIIDNNSNAVTPCSAIAVASDNQADAEAQALKSYGSGYSIGKVLTADQFNSGTACQ